MNSTAHTKRIVIIAGPRTIKGVSFELFFADVANESKIEADPLNWTL